VGILDTVPNGVGQISVGSGGHSQGGPVTRAAEAGGGMRQFATEVVEEIGCDALDFAQNVTQVAQSAVRLPGGCRGGCWCRMLVSLVVPQWMSCL
jgi:hypothetical protein